jgi:hypothetical protein
MFDKRRIRKNGLPAQAFVLSTVERSSFSSNSWRKYDYVLEVRPEGRAPFQAQLQETFYMIESKPKETDLLQVKYDPKTLQVVFDLEGDPRYDVEAMNRRSTQMRWETHNRQAQGMSMPPGGSPFGAAAAAAAVAAAVAAAAATPAASAGPMDDRIQALERLARLRDSGAISTEEFEVLKADLMRGSS